MSVIYIETSAALAWLLGKKRARQVEACLDAASGIVSSVLTMIEAHWVLARSEALGLLASAAASKLRGALVKRSAEWRLLELTVGHS